MTILLGFISAAGAVAVLVCAFAGNDPGYAEAGAPAQGWPAQGWDQAGRLAGYRLGRWAEERPAHHHSEPTLDEVTTCLYCGSPAHSTFLHASR
jgi:hypothetical protein